MDSSKIIGAKIAAAAGGFQAVAAMPAYARAGILLKISEEIEKESEAFAGLICEEVFKPIKDARKEVARAAFNFRWAGEEARRFGGELFPLDFDASSVGRTAFIKRVPLGPCGFITPFNFPLNLVAHKAAPAMAIGASFVLKPASVAVRTAQKLRDIALKAGWPAEAFQLAVCRGAEAMEIVKDPRLKVISFTGFQKRPYALRRNQGVGRRTGRDTLRDGRINGNKNAFNQAVAVTAQVDRL